MGILSGNPQNEPMHYGEVYQVWMFYFSGKASIAKYQTLLNHTGDEDLSKFIRDKIENLVKPNVEEIEKLLKANGVALPPAPPERPAASVESIPPGARVTDPEIAAMLTMDLAAGLVACSSIMGQSLREDIGLMFGKIHTQKAQYGARLLRLNKDKGWLIPPPLHVGAPEEKA